MLPFAQILIYFFAQVVFHLDICDSDTMNAGETNMGAEKPVDPWTREDRIASAM